MVSARILALSATVLAVLFQLQPLSAQLGQKLFDVNTAPAKQTTEKPKLTAEQRGDVFMARKMYREAVDAYRESSQNSAVIWNKIGIAYHQLGDFNAAKKHYERATKLDSKYADAINNLGTVFYAQKKYRGAISRYKRALTYTPRAASIWSNLGTAYYARGKFDQMFEAYQTALSIDPQVFEHRGSFGVLMQERTVADRARYHFEMARMYAHTGQNDLALQYLRKSLEEGFKDKDKLNDVPEFATLRDTPEFKELLTLEPRVL